jgi:hypothetical protein
LEKGFYIINKYAMENAVQEVDQSFGCKCGGWHLSVQKLHTPILPALPKKEDPASKESKSAVQSVPETV